MTGRMLGVLVLVAVLLPGCSRVGGAIANFGQWVQGLDRMPTEDVTTREKRRVQR